MASDLLKVWKKIVIEETVRKKNGTIDYKSSIKTERAQREAMQVAKVRTNLAKLQNAFGEDCQSFKKSSGRDYQGRKDFQDGELCEVTIEADFIDKCNDAIHDKILDNYRIGPSIKYIYPSNM